MCVMMQVGVCARTSYYRKQEVEEELTLDNRQKDDVQCLACFQYSFGFSLILNKLKCINTISVHDQKV